MEQNLLQNMGRVMGSAVSMVNDKLDARTLTRTEPNITAMLSIPKEDRFHEMWVDVVDTGETYVYNASTDTFENLLDLGDAGLPITPIDKLAAMDLGNVSDEVIRARLEKIGLSMGLELTNEQIQEIASQVQAEAGENGLDGANGVDGKSAYDLWLEAGNTGTEADFLASMKGDAGVDGANGVDGKSAYEIWLEAGNTGTEEDFLNSLKATSGSAGGGFDNNFFKGI